MLKYVTFLLQDTKTWQCVLVFAIIYEGIAMKLLGLTFDSGLPFDTHVKVIDKRASQRLTAIKQIVNTLSEYKIKSLLKTFFEFQFKYCPLIWMLYEVTSNQKVNKLHEHMTIIFLFLRNF